MVCAYEFQEVLMHGGVFAQLRVERRSHQVSLPHQDGLAAIFREAFDSVPFLELLTAYGSPWGKQELTP